MKPYETWNDALEDEMTRIRCLLSRKNLAYGKESITEAGPMAIISKLLSKIHRLRNLAVRDVERAMTEDTQIIIGEESVSDTLRDIIGFALIYLTVMEGTFELPTVLETYDNETGTSQRNVSFDNGGDDRTDATDQ